MTEPGLAANVFLWSLTIFFAVFMFLLVLHFAGFVWKSFRNDR